MGELCVCDFRLDHVIKHVPVLFIIPFLVFTYADNDTVEEFHVPVTDTPGVYEPWELSTVSYPLSLSPVAHHRLLVHFTRFSRMLLHEHPQTT